MNQWRERRDENDEVKKGGRGDHEEMTSRPRASKGIHRLDGREGRGGGHDGMATGVYDCATSSSEISSTVRTIARPVPSKCKFI